MNYKLYTLVDITHTNQYRHEHGKETAWHCEQNFNTVLQTLGLRANITYSQNPVVTEVAGRVVGFETNDIIRVWRFDFSTERDFLFEKDGDPVGYLKDDFHLVPYIQGLGELMDQKHPVFSTTNPGANIIFQVKQ